ncbi:transposase [Pelotalea chapellei]|uniref:Transposase n=1 Tax=Pelotalea chapellei TaxID=44671 RepID=A0ABS5U8R3_9BACT|nr:transposase [Pelotalea chapellei]MBT1072034.1 transposase [Pelotalea chapellei]
MARANRHHIPGQVWHITHRCHKKEFLLKFEKDRRRCHSWLFEAKKRFGLRVLNYVVTSNHIHLLVVDSGPDVIPNSIQLIAGRTAQEFNLRKDRKGAFWEDRYHATAIERNEHLIRCLVYIDLNMVRAGVVKHPSEWEAGGFNEIQNPPMRYGVIDRQGLHEFCGVPANESFADHHRQWVQDALQNSESKRDNRWTDAIAVGSGYYVEAIKARLGMKAASRRIERQQDDVCILREEPVPYKAVFDLENEALSLNNCYFWE